jgi:hypothetical protein
MIQKTKTDLAAVKNVEGIIRTKGNILRRVSVERILLGAVFSVLLMWQLVYGKPTAKYIEILWTNTSIPIIQWRQNTSPLLSLPLKLKETIKRKFPQDRLPGNQDYSGDWVESYEYRSPEEQEHEAPLNLERLYQQKVPFLTWGDYNRDGMLDVATLLRGKKSPQGWKFVVFHGTQTVYKPMVLDMGKDSITRYSISTEFESLIQETIAGHGKRTKGKMYKTPGIYIILALSESAASSYFWDKAKNQYVRVWISD